MALAVALRNTTRAYAENQSELSTTQNPMKRFPHMRLRSAK